MLKKLKNIILIYFQKKTNEARFIVNDEDTILPSCPKDYGGSYLKMWSFQSVFCLKIY